ncbi:hypothetical protein AB2762_05190 [Acinetobacter indicus]
MQGFVAQRFHNYMILKVLIIFDPKLNLFKSDAYIFMQQSHDAIKNASHVGGIFTSSTCVQTCLFMH